MVQGSGAARTGKLSGGHIVSGGAGHIIVWYHWGAHRLQCPVGGVLPVQAGGEGETELMWRRRRRRRRIISDDEVRHQHPAGGAHPVHNLQNLETEHVELNCWSGFVSQLGSALIKPRLHP